MNTSLPVKEDLDKLYASGFSMVEISHKLGYSLHKVAYWMKKYDLKRRSRSDALYVKHNPEGDPFRIKEIITKEDALLKGFGLGIYWGEGNKVTPHSIRVANTDPSLILTFRRFLIEICQVKQEKIGYSIVCFNDSNVITVVQFWSNLLGTNADKFGKIVRIATQGKGNYTKKSKFGVCTISFHNYKLKFWLMNELQILGKG